MKWPGTHQWYCPMRSVTEPGVVVCVAWTFHLMLVHCFWKDVEQFQAKSWAGWCSADQ
jgi:hypothetical protein